MKKKIVILFLVIIFISGCYHANNKDTSEVIGDSVVIEDFKFIPGNLVVSVGTTVIWTHNDGAPHTVTTTKAPVDFDSGIMNKGEQFSQTFDTIGTYEYYCSIHPNIKGKVIVK